MCDIEAQCQSIKLKLLVYKRWLAQNKKTILGPRFVYIQTALEKREQHKEKDKRERERTIIFWENILPIWYERRYHLSGSGWLDSLCPFRGGWSKEENTRRWFFSLSHSVTTLFRWRKSQHWSSCDVFIVCVKKVYSMGERAMSMRESLFTRDYGRLG